MMNNLTDPCTATLVEHSAAFRCKGVRLLNFPLIPDARGSLMFAEFPTHLPFQPLRFFTTYDVPVGSIRGEHAHRKLEQLIICQKGTLSVMVDDGIVRETCVLDNPGIGLYIPPLTWGVQFGHSADCIMLVLASDIYSEDGYLRKYDDFLAAVKDCNQANP